MWQTANVRIPASDVRRSGAAGRAWAWALVIHANYLINLAAAQAHAADSVDTGIS